jgi:hypothetical protein
MMMREAILVSDTKAIEFTDEMLIRRAKVSAVFATVYVGIAIILFEVVVPFVNETSSALAWYWRLGLFFLIWAAMFVGSFALARETEPPVKRNTSNTERG